MIWRPKTGETVQVRYRKELRDRIWSWHEIYGRVGRVATGNRCVNAEVIFYNSVGSEIDRDIIPRGNLFKIKEQNNAKQQSNFDA